MKVYHIISYLKDAFDELCSAVKLFWKLVTIEQKKLIFDIWMRRTSVKKTLNFNLKLPFVGLHFRFMYVTDLIGKQ